MLHNFLYKNINLRVFNWYFDGSVQLNLLVEAKLYSSDANKEVYTIGYRKIKPFYAYKKIMQVTLPTANHGFLRVLKAISDAI